jgi:hypothetical protein
MPQNLSHGVPQFPPRFGFHFTDTTKLLRLKGQFQEVILSSGAIAAGRSQHIGYMPFVAYWGTALARNSTTVAVVGPLQILISVGVFLGKPDDGVCAAKPELRFRVRSKRAFENFDSVCLRVQSQYISRPWT